MKYFSFFLIAIALSIVSNADAHETVKNYNQVSLEVSSSAEVENDTMIVSLYALEEGSKPVELGNRVNKKINWALEKLKQYKIIKVETESYSTNPVYNKSQIIAWRVQQSIQLESKDIPLMSEVLAELQQQLKLSGLSFDVSTDKRERQTQLLIDQALAAYSQRATQIANKLQHDRYKIVTMNVSTSANIGQYKYRAAGAMLADAEMAQAVAPEVASGDQTLTVRVSGTIELE
jgi:predicted secreted protein